MPPNLENVHANSGVWTSSPLLVDEKHDEPGLQLSAGKEKLPQGTTSQMLTPDALEDTQQVKEVSSCKPFSMDFKVDRAFFASTHPVTGMQLLSFVVVWSRLHWWQVDSLLAVGKHHTPTKSVRLCWSWLVSNRRRIVMPLVLQRKARKSNALFCDNRLLYRVPMGHPPTL